MEPINLEKMVRKLYELPTSVEDVRRSLAVGQPVPGTVDWFRRAAGLAPMSVANQVLTSLGNRTHQMALEIEKWKPTEIVVSEPINGVLEDGSLLFETRKLEVRPPTQYEVLQAARYVDQVTYTTYRKLAEATVEKFAHLRRVMPAKANVVRPFENLVLKLTDYWSATVSKGMVSFGACKSFVLSPFRWAHRLYSGIDAVDVALCAIAVGVIVYAAARAYKWSQRELLLRHDRLIDERYDYLNGDLGLAGNIRMIAQPAMVNWAMKMRDRLARRTKYGTDLYTAQRELRIAFERATEYDVGTEFIHGCISSLGNFTLLSKGELWIQLNRHLQAFIRARAADHNPLTVADIGGLRASMDFVCGDHVQVQISR